MISKPHRVRRAILIMVKAGQPVDDVIAELEPMLSPGDILIDGVIASIMTPSVARKI